MQQSNEAPLASLVVWEGEWPLVKQQVVRTRQCIENVYGRVRNVVDIPNYVAAARRCQHSTDRRVSEFAMDAQASMQKHEWVARAFCILATSSFVMAKSVTFGPYKTARNGMLCAAALTATLFPLEAAQLFFGRHVTEMSNQRYF